MSTKSPYSSPAVAGSGAIATGLAATITTVGEVQLLARSDTSAWRAEEQVEKLCGKLEGADASKLRVTTDPGDLAGCDLVVEAIAEEFDAKVAMHQDLDRALAEGSPNADLATTTSSLGIRALASEVGATDRFYGLHVFNPVHRMDLVELCLPDGLADGVADRARAFCQAIGKTAIEVPDTAGFVVNRLLFPFLFDAVRFLESSGMDPEDVDACMAMGAGHPMGPLKLIDFVGVDVCIAIGESLHAESGEGYQAPPDRLRSMAAEGKLGRKSGEGFYAY